MRGTRALQARLSAGKEQTLSAPHLACVPRFGHPTSVLSQSTARGRTSGARDLREARSSAPNACGAQSGQMDAMPSHPMHDTSPEAAAQDAAASLLTEHRGAPTSHEPSNVLPTHRVLVRVEFSTTTTRTRDTDARTHTHGTTDTTGNGTHGLVHQTARTHARYYNNIYMLHPPRTLLTDRASSLFAHHATSTSKLTRCASAFAMCLWCGAAVSR